MKLSSNQGISIIEAMVAVAIMTGLALSSSYFLTNTNVIGKKTEIKASIDQIHVLQVQRVRNSNNLRTQVQASFLAVVGADLQIFKDCFDGSKNRSLCATPGPGPGTSYIPTLWTSGLSIQTLNSSGTFNMFGETNAFESRVIWNANCAADYCRSIDVRITTQPVAGSKYDQKLEPRITILNFAAQILVNQKSTRFTCARPPSTQIAYRIFNNLNRADCDETFFASVAQTGCTEQYPMENFGAIAVAFPADTCQPTGITNCVGPGYDRIAFNTSPCRSR